MKVMCVLVSMFMGCVSYDSTSVVTDNVEAKRLTWMVGNWLCKTSYHDVGPFTEHSVEATYVISGDTSANPVIITADYSEVETSFSEQQEWILGTTQTIFGTVDFSFAGDDNQRSSTKASGFNGLAGAHLDGVFRAADGSEIPWNMDGGPRDIPTDSIWSSTWRINIGGKLTNYKDMLCTRASDVQNEVIALPSLSSAELLDMAKISVQHELAQSNIELDLPASCFTWHGGGSTGSDYVCSSCTDGTSSCTFCSDGYNYCV